MPLPQPFPHPLSNLAPILLNPAIENPAQSLRFLGDGKPTLMLVFEDYSRGVPFFVAGPRGPGGVGGGYRFRFWVFEREVRMSRGRGWRWRRRGLGELDIDESPERGAGRGRWVGDFEGWRGHV